MTKEMENYHSIGLNTERCIGCTRCIRNCPTEAIRVQNEKARILSNRCIDCGECIRSCLQKAKGATSDTLTDLHKFKHNIALVAPTLYAQFAGQYNIGKILAAVKKLGFDEVIEVAEGADLVTQAVREYITHYQGAKPFISSSCPAVVRLIRVKYPMLLPHLIPIESPMEVMARKLRRERPGQLGCKPKEIGLFFISPCPAKMTAVRAPLGTAYSDVDGVLSIVELYGDILKNLSDNNLTEQEVAASVSGINWAKAGGERAALGLRNQLAVDGIHNIIRVFDELELGKLTDVDYIECLACPGGCLGGPLTVENPYAGAMRLKRLVEKGGQLTVERKDQLIAYYNDNKELFHFTEPIAAKDITKLSDNMLEALERMDRLEKLVQDLPGLDCGACGAPNCRALAEDVVTEFRPIEDCIVLLRRKQD